MTTTTGPKPTDSYMPASAYNRMLDAILNPAPSLDPRGQLIELLGTQAGIWSDECLRDADPAQMARDDIKRMTANLDLTHDDQKAIDRLEAMLTDLHAAEIELATA